MGKNNFSFCKSRFRSLQLEEAHANEINYVIHLANTLFQIEVRYKKYGCRLQWFITVHVNFITENIDALKRYKSTEVERRTWPHVPSQTPWSTSSDTYQVVEIKKETSTEMYTNMRYYNKGLFYINRKCFPSIVVILKLIMVRCVLKLTVIHNLHLFYQ